MKFDTEPENLESQLFPPRPGILSFWQMDCMKLMADFPDNYFDLAIVDPPYGINVGGNKQGIGRRKGAAKETAQTSFL